MPAPKDPVKNKKWRKEMSKIIKRLGNKPPSHLGKKRSEETKKRMSEALKGRIFSEEHKKRLSEAQKGHTAWNKGIKGIYHLSEKAKRKIGLAHRGKKLSEEWKRKISEAHRGEKSYNWQGGITTKHLRIRMGIEIRLWRKAVFERDDFICQKCGKPGGGLNAHHIFNFADYPELRTSIENGITLCKSCHELFHKIYGKKNNTKEQLETFLI